MYCKECGNLINENDKFCTVCGERIEQNQFDISYNYNVDKVNMPIQPPVNQQLQDLNDINKRKNKIKILLISALILATIGLVVFLIFYFRYKEQREVIEDYFEAINDKDIEEIYELSYTNENMVGLHTLENEKEFFFTNSIIMGFSRGLYDVDAFKFTACVYDSYNTKGNDLDIKNSDEHSLDALKVSYKIVNIAPLENFDLYTNRGTNLTKIDMNNIESIVSRFDSETGKRVDVPIDEVYVAQLKIEWEYFGRPYGMVKSWWKNKEFKEQVNKYGAGHFNTYDDAIEYMETINGEEKVYVLILYKSKGDWYIYRGDRLADLATSYENGKAIIKGY